MKFAAISALFLLAVSIPIAQAQECNEENQVLSDEPVDLNAFAPLLTLKIPEICGEFNPLQLVPCRGEINVISGCCMSSCSKIFDQYSIECLKDLTEQLCQNKGTSIAVPILNSVASRCDADYSPLECDDATNNIVDISVSAYGPEAEASASEIDLDEYFEELVNSFF